MNHQNRKQVTSDDGSIYEVEALCLSDVGTSNVLVISKEMQAIAIALLPSAHSMAKSREKRVFFYEKSERRLEAYGEQTFLQAKEMSREANNYAHTLELVAKGFSEMGPRRVTLRDWLEIMTVFHQPQIHNIEG